MPLPSNATDLCPWPGSSPNPRRSNSTLRDLCAAFGAQLTAQVDKELCERPCSPASPCLYDVASDPQERRNLAARLPAVASALMERLEGYAARVRLPITIPDPGGYCAAMRGRGAGPGGTQGFNGPWLQ